MNARKIGDVLREQSWLRPLRTARLRHLARHSGLPDWRTILGADWPEWEATRERAAAGPRVLLATSTGGHLGIAALDAALAVALTLRGANVEFLLCDEVLPACQMCEAGLYPRLERFLDDGPRRDICGRCYAPAVRMIEGLGLTLRRYGDHLGPGDRARLDGMAVTRRTSAIADYVIDDIPVGEHALAGALRFYARGTLQGEPRGEAVLRRYLRAALYTSQSLLRLLDRHTYRTVVAHHGIYIPQGIVTEVAKQSDTRAVTWNPAYRRHCFIFSHDESYHRTLMSEPQDAWESLELTRTLEERTMRYLRSRRTGAEDWIWFHERPRQDGGAIAEAIGLDPSRPVIGLLTNVVWDAQLHYESNAFDSMLDWLRETVEWFATRPDLQLVIRVHPAEIHGRPASRQPVSEFLDQTFPELPPNVFVIPPESDVSTYAVMEGCNAALIFGTKMGVELASLGIPVIVAGEAWIRNKGLTFDASSRDEYFRLLASLPFEAPLDAQTTERARRYAFHFFFRRMIPLPFMQPTGGWPPFRVSADGLDPFRPGSTPGLDVICDGILDRAPFIYPAELLDV